MSTRKRFMYSLFSISLILTTLNFQTVFASAEVNLADSLDEAEIKSTINTYIQ